MFVKSQYDFIKRKYALQKKSPKVISLKRIFLFDEDPY